MKGLYEECQYLFQPQLIVQRLIGIPVLYPGYLIDQMIPVHNKSALYKVYIPNYSSRVKVQLKDCRISNRTMESCPVFLKIRAKAPPLHNSTYIDCKDRMSCELETKLPFWEQWYYILVDRYIGNVNFYFRIQVQVKDCSKPSIARSSSPNSALNMPQSFGSPMGLSLTDSLPAAGLPPMMQNTSERKRFDVCSNVTAEVYLRSYLTPCINDCGTYGQCKLLRTNNFLYAACECKAGWDGWGCTDNSVAYSYGFQLLSTLLLCLSNLMFVPPVAIAIRSHCLLEASVYIFTMFFSTFYHACDQPGVVVFCIMEYDVLQFCDFLGSLMSVWVTVISMARLQSIIKQVLYLLGAMALSMALQLDRHGLWNLLGPSIFALGIMAIAWTVRTIRRRRCYPPTWKRWVFYLFPGTMIATSAVALYAFVETEENYFYIHSIWHMLIAGSVGFLLPPRAKHDNKVPPFQRRRGCGYQLCVNEHEEMGLVDPAIVSINSICAS
ncbi:UNVERIFIED_CONTAM: hypothetical protein FKN15_042434 [Acipenser sinensis]